MGHAPFTGKMLCLFTELILCAFRWIVGSCLPVSLEELKILRSQNHQERLYFKSCGDFPLEKRRTAMKSMLVLLVLISLIAVVGGCKAQVDSNGASVQKTS
jgi:hypothetical protein